MRRQLRRADALFGNAWRAAPLLATACVLVALGSSLFMLGYPLGFRAIVDGAADHQPGRIVAGLVIVAITFPGSWALQLVGGALNSKLTDLTNLRVSMRIGALACAAPYLEHFERPDYLTEIDTLRERRRTLAAAPAQTLGLAKSAIQFTGIAVLLALVWPPLIVVPLLAAAPAWADRRGAQVEKRSDDALADRRRLLGELFSLASTAAPARELRTFGVTGALLERHARLGDEVNARSLVAARTAALWEACGWIVYSAGFGVAIVALVLRAAHGAASPGSVVEVVSLLRRAQRQVAGATTSAGSFATASATANRLLWLEDYVAATAPATATGVPERLTEGIRFEHVSFGYPGQDAIALRDICLTLQAGTTVAIVGENGAGKSTLIKLLTGMYRPRSGRITVDGQDLAEISPSHWRTATTGAFQDYVRFFMTLGDGVGAGDLPRIEDREAVAGALERAGAGDIAEPDTLLGPWIGGRSLSGGQWQRLALARGLMRDRPLLIVLDEPTASLDALSEAALFDRYREAARRLGEEKGEGEAGGAITVLVSHRFSTVHMADAIVVMDGGEIKEVGDHDTLMASGGVYAELFTLQAASYA